MQPGADWSGEIAVELAVAEDLRETVQVVLTGFLGQPVTLVVVQKKTGTFLGGPFKMNAENRTNLSADIWESVARDFEKAASLFHQKEPS